MGAIELDQLLLLAAIVAGIVLALSTLVVTVRTRRIEDRFLDLDVLQDSIQRIEEELGEIGRRVNRMSDTLSGLSALGLHLRELKREQLRVSENLESIRASAGTSEDLAQVRHDL